MKLIIQIPCLNEAKSLPKTLNSLPKQIDGIDVIEILIIDDGSTDKTSEVAQNWGVHHIMRFTKRKGLARAFHAGLNACLNVEADIIVNTDGDNQYCGKDIPKLIAPIVAKQADIVVGARPILKHQEFSIAKKTIWMPFEPVSGNLRDIDFVRKANNGYFYTHSPPRADL